MSKMIYRLLVIMAVAILGSGCAGMQSMSSYARTGDTVTIAIGGSEGNVLVPVLKKENLNVTITDSAANTFPVKVRYVYKVNPDPASRYAFRAGPSNLSSAGFETYASPHQGQWMAAVDLVDPATDVPLALAQGPAALSISSPGEINPTFKYYQYLTGTNGDLTSVAIEILPGTGQSNPMNYISNLSFDPMVSLEPVPQVFVSLNGTPTGDLGGGEFVFSFVTSDLIITGGYPPRVVPADLDANVQLVMNRIDQGNGTTLLKVLIMNPEGFKPDNSRTYDMINGKSLLRSLNFSIVWDPANQVVTDANWQNSLQLVEANYIDINGAPVPGLTATLEKVR